MRTNISVSLVRQGPSLQITDYTNQRTYEYTFKEISTEELMQRRLSTQPGIVYKRGNQLFFVNVPENLKISNSEMNIGTHLCGKNCPHVCKGCERTSDLTVPYQMRLRKIFYLAVEDSWRIEKYKFITEGMEAFNMGPGYDALIVLKCSCYTPLKRIPTPDYPQNIF